MQSNPQNPSFLAEFNHCICLPSGVYASSEHPEGLSYSDGDAEEEYIYQAVSIAQDVSSLSEELRCFERDWASECHLSSKRSNVFRGLDFSGVAQILEVGSGCGAITRFLGELGKRVDAVEGSLRRAEITRLRCRDLANVSVIHSDFSKLLLPADYYDLAFLTGVLEYAGKYGKTGQNPSEAAVTMLQKIFDGLRPTGKIVVAIENRLGFKYLAGACEDHFSRPWVGLCQYPDCDEPHYQGKKGIETWDRTQWEKMIKNLPGVSCEWYYPFPDYKLATSLLSENFIHKSPFAASSLTRVHSRDYSAMWHPQLDEQLFWQTAGSANMLEEMANSFVLVLQKTQGSDASIVPFDFIHFSGQTRKPEYRTMVQKVKGQPRVEKKQLFAHLPPPESDIISQHLEEEPYHEGELLITFWLRSLKSCSSSGTLDDLLKLYYSYIQDKCKSISPAKLIDLLPMNIVVTPTGEWKCFDQEWQAEGDISPQFILFRAVLYLFWDHKDTLFPFCSSHNLSSGWQFVEHCLGRILYSNEIDIPAFVELENTIQQAISREDAFTPIEDLLDSSPDPLPQTWSWSKVSLIWEGTNEPVHPIKVGETESGISSYFTLPVDVCRSSFIQLHLGGHHLDVGSVFTVPGFSIYGVRGDGSRDSLFPGESNSSLLPLIQLTGISFYDSVRGGVYTLDDKETQILHFSFPQNIDSKKYSTIECEVKLDFLPLTADAVKKEKFKLEKQEVDIALNESNQLIAEKVEEIINRDNLIAEKTEEIISRDKVIAEKIDEVHALYDQVERQKHRLIEIEESKAWQIILKLRRAKTVLVQLAGKKTLKHQGETDPNNTVACSSVSDCTPEKNDESVNRISGKNKQGCTQKIKGVVGATSNNYDDEVNRKDERLKLSVGTYKISIIIGVYNTVPAYLKEVIQSVLTQTYFHWEIIIVDSGSTNGATLKMLSGINHSRIKVHCAGEMANLTQAMVEGVKLASGDWLTFLGHYDRLRPDALDVMARKIQEQDIDLFCWDEVIINRDGEMLETLRKQNSWDGNQPPDDDPVGSTLCVRQSCYRQVGGLDTSFDGVQFFEFALRARRLNCNFLSLAEILSETRRFESLTKEEQDRLQTLRSRAWNACFSGQKKDTLSS